MSGWVVFFVPLGMTCMTFFSGGGIPDEGASSLLRHGAFSAFFVRLVGGPLGVSTFSFSPRKSHPANGCSMTEKQLFHPQVFNLVCLGFILIFFVGLSIVTEANCAVQGKDRFRIDVERLYDALDE